LEYIVAIVLGIVFGLIGLAIGSSKGKPGRGFVLGFFLGPIGLIFAALMQPSDSAKHATPAPKVQRNKQQVESDQIIQVAEHETTGQKGKSGTLVYCAECGMLIEDLVKSKRCTQCGRIYHYNEYGEKCGYSGYNQKVCNICTDAKKKRDNVRHTGRSNMGGGCVMFIFAGAIAFFMFVTYAEEGESFFALIGVGSGLIAFIGIILFFSGLGKSQSN
jgi:hypothetical protein